jgi:hypothetical protein
MVGNRTRGRPRGSQSRKKTSRATESAIQEALEEVRELDAIEEVDKDLPVDYISGSPRDQKKSAGRFAVWGLGEAIKRPIQPPNCNRNLPADFFDSTGSPK